MNNSNYSFKLDSDLAIRLVMLFAAISAILLANDSALAADAATTTEAANDDPLSQTFCTILKPLTGPVARGIATIAIFALGVGIFLGRLSWGVALATAFGVALIFAAEQIIDWLGGADAARCED